MESKDQLSRREGLQLLAGATALGVLLKPSSAPSIPQKDACFTDPDGTDHVTRVVPVPGTISSQAREFISRPVPSGPPRSLAERRKGTDEFRIKRAAEAKRLFPVNVQPKQIGGVRCDIITPLSTPASRRDCVLINVHGGGFVTDSGSLVEGIPIAHLAQTKVVSVYYRLAPEHPFPAAVDDTVAVYRELLKTYKPKNIALFGTSAGAILTGEVGSALKRRGMPVPGAFGIFTGAGDMSQPGDTQAIYALNGFRGQLEPPAGGPLIKSYVGHTNPRDPVLSPIYSDLRGMPPTLFVTATRDMLLSGTALLHRAYLRAGNRAELVVFEALPHAFWYDYSLPETTEALHIMSNFFTNHVGA